MQSLFCHLTLAQIDWGMSCHIETILIQSVLVMALADLISLRVGQHPCRLVRQEQMWKPEDDDFKELTLERCAYLFGGKEGTEEHLVYIYIHIIIYIYIYIYIHVYPEP